MCAFFAPLECDGYSAFRYTIDSLVSNGGPRMVFGWNMYRFVGKMNISGFWLVCCL